MFERFPGAAYKGQAATREIRKRSRVCQPEGVSKRDVIEAFRHLAVSHHHNMPKASYAIRIAKRVWAKQEDNS